MSACGFAAHGVSGHGVFGGDTGCNPTFWARVNQLPAALLVIETAFSNCEQALAARSLHLAPCVLATEIDQIAPGQHYPTCIAHTKSAETNLGMEEIACFGHPPSRTSNPAHASRWLSAGMYLGV